MKFRLESEQKINSGLEAGNWAQGFSQQELEQHPPALIISDYSLPGFNWHDALALALEKCPETPFIFVTGTAAQ